VLESAPWLGYKHAHFPWYAVMAVRKINNMF